MVWSYRDDGMAIVTVKLLHRRLVGIHDREKIILARLRSDHGPRLEIVLYLDFHEERDPTGLTIASVVAGARAPESVQARRQKSDRANHRVTSEHRR